MEPMQICALLYPKQTEEAHRAQLEQYFVARDRTRAMWRERVRRLRRRLFGRGWPRPKALELASTSSAQRVGISAGGPL